jgi:V/A-type H+-transporting ATPase subunit I
VSLNLTSKVRIYSSNSNFSSLFSFLQEKACFQVSEYKGDINGLGPDLSKIDFAINYLSAYASKKNGLRALALGDKVEITTSEVDSIISTFDWKSLVKKTVSLEKEKNDLVSKIQEKENLLKSFEGWNSVGLVNSNNFFFSIYFIEIPLQSASLFFESLENHTNLFYKEEVSNSTKTVRFCVCIEKSNISFFSNLLSIYKAHNLEVNLNSSPFEVIKSLNSDLLSLNQQLKNNINLTSALTVDIYKLKVLYDDFYSLLVKEKSKEFAMKSDFIFYIEGFVPLKLLRLFQYDLEKKYNYIYIEKIDSDKKDNPVIMESSELVKPIQEITKMYGTPSARELDPTVYYAVFYVIFFGFCLTDAGYGLILMMLTGIPLLMNLPFSQEVKNIIKMFFYGGVSTFILGVLFGGYFGLTVDQVPSFLTYVRADGDIMFLGQIINPMVDLVTKVMPVTYLLGLSHLLLGVYLSGKIAWNNGNKDKMYFVVIPIFLFFLSSWLAWGQGVGGLDYIAYSCLAFIVWGLGENGNPFIRTLKGVGSLINECLSWFQNILSYSRLFALGLATGVIAMAFNIVATTLGGMITGWLGFVVMILVLLFGHILNIMLNLLGAYVHSSRLQFVEFFGLFLKGGGKVFRPMKKERRYLLLSKE